MSSPTLQPTFEAAIQHHQAGRLREAEIIYRQVLARQPDHAQALHHLGLIAHQAGRDDIAIDLIGQAGKIDPNAPDIQSNLGVVLKSTGRLDDAIAAYCRAISLRPDYPEAHNNLGVALKEKGDLDGAIAAYRVAVAQRPTYAEALVNLANTLRDKREYGPAISIYRQALTFHPNYAEAHNHLGVALAEQGRLDEAILAYRRAIALNPQYSQPHNNLGAALRDQGNLDQAIAAFRAAIALNPKYAHAYNNLGAALKDIGHLDEAVATFRGAIAIRPNYLEAYNNLGVTLKRKGQFDDAIAAYRHALLLNPAHADAYSNLGNALKDKGEVAAALDAYRQSLAIKPESHPTHSNLLATMHCDQSFSAGAIAEEHRRWNVLHAEAVAKLAAWQSREEGAARAGTAGDDAKIPPAGVESQTNGPNFDLHRRLRIGYVSPDFREHPVGRFLLGLFENHYRAARGQLGATQSPRDPTETRDDSPFEIFCYSNVIAPDAMTARLRSQVDHWRDIAHLGDEAVAKMIREDRIDILVDLAGHTGGGRLLLFARKPAPIQVTYLGYPDTTGLNTIDYRFTDPHADPPGLTDHLHSEKLFRLPHTAWCFSEPEDAPHVEPPPSQKTNHITFGSFNNLAKVTEPMLEAWAKILRAVPNAKLYLKAPGLEAETSRQRIGTFLAAQQIDAARVDFRGPQASHALHLAQYHQLDIALDTFPYHGTTTTCDALWMGVPVITRAGQTHVSRVGVSLLSNIGLPDLIADDLDDYIKIATALAGDRDRLQQLRYSLRNRMRASPLMDARSFAREIESAYRQMWRAHGERVRLNLR
jgi:predicted O-linked N-acetylglucosamine transferase (SPINDLY family)